MSTRRQSSTTSLAQYARATSPDTSVRNLDFCNAFWGVGDGGVDVLFARMRGAGRTTEELRNFWKERSVIEEEYAKRMAKLAKMVVGKDEIGELRNAIDTLRLATDKQAGFHLHLAQRIRTEFESKVGAFVNKQQHHKKVYQAAIEKEFKVKQTREQHANKAREKYESDCLRINSYTAQSTLVQGKDLEKIHLKLERAQQTVQVNENDYVQFTKVLQETMQNWEQHWKAFCDTCQDLEEERIDFLKENMWGYANAVSTVCVSDDESCEKIRLALEQLEPDKDMENFVRDYGTGNMIPEPPVFINYANTDAPPISTSRISTRPSTFSRSTQLTSRAGIPPDDEPHQDTSRAGVGAGGPSRSTPTDPNSLSRSATQKSTASSQSRANGINGHVSPFRDSQRQQSTASTHSKFSTPVDPVDPMVSNTQLVIGDRTFDVDPNKDPQQQVTATPASRTSPPTGNQDPLVKQMAELSTAAAASGTARRNTIRRESPPSSAESRKGTLDSSTPSTTTTISASPAPRDFRNSAEVVVGSYPLARAPSRSASPNPPKAVLVAPPPPSVPPSTSNIPVEQVVSGYQRPFPGEPRSRANSYVGPPPPAVNQNAEPSRPASRTGYPGVGTQSLVPRLPSPARGPSPTVHPYNRVAPVQSPNAPPSNSAPHRVMSVHRSVTPTNPVGIALGQDGRVVHDMMVQPVRQMSMSYPQPGPPPQATQPPQAYPVYHDSSRALTHAQQPVQQPSPSRNDYAMVAQGGYAGHVQPYNYGHQTQHARAHSVYDGGYRPQSYGQLAPVQSQVEMEVQAHAQAPVNYNPYGTVARTAYHGHQQSPSVGHIAGSSTQRYGANGNAAMYRSTSPGVRRSPSPAPPRSQKPPTGSYTDDGRPILFYVKALYDYVATIDEEFDFQSGDIIAVTDTPEDGWWSGELLDETRRQAGRNVFPSNFVCLF